MLVPSQVQIERLVERFERNLPEYRSEHYNETQTRREFIDPFFEALGWDVGNTRGLPATYKDVIHEDTIKIALADMPKRPDYAFRLDGRRKFFVEAKKPAINLRDDAKSAFQLRRYGWSAKLPISVVTNFAQLAVYDCRVKPDQHDNPAAARLLLLDHTDYLARWDDIDRFLSFEAVLAGFLDAFAVAPAMQKGVATVDDAFLKDIEHWRDILAQDISARNSDLTQRQLNFSVQMTIDRIIFLRICEDRGIEPYGRLQSIAVSGDVYSNLCQLFHLADDRYNSGLFHFRSERDRLEAPDDLTPHLAVGDEALKAVVTGLYYPDSPYEFSVLPADILGQVYEQFLGKVIRLTAEHQAVVEEKPEVRKAGGVYYTPTYIVDYIVKQTVGPLVDGKSPKQAAALRIVDPACGSGSFLIAAYQFLLDWYRDRYIEEGVTKHRKELVQDASDTWKLTTAERKRILLQHIYGVDIDTQAVEVTKLSLLLKVLEGESEQNLTQQIVMFHERALPDLSGNIRCGNALIGSDFYQGEQLSLFDDELRYRVNAFDWRTEFPAAFMDTSPGFDAVIGNPPYGYMIPAPEQAYFLRRFGHQDYQQDLYLLFLERYNDLLREGGLLGVIVSNTWLQSITLRSIRQHLASRYVWLRILHLPEKVFKATVDTHVLIWQKATGPSIVAGNVEVDIRRNGTIVPWHALPRAEIPRDGEPINIVAPIDVQRLVRRIRSTSEPLSAYCDVYNGVKPFEIGKGNPPQTGEIQRLKPYVRTGPQPDATWSPLLRGSHIHRYDLVWDHDYWIQYGTWLAAPRDPAIFTAPDKIMVRQTGDSIIATHVADGFIARNNVHILLPRDHNVGLNYVLGIMNSRLMDFVYTVMNPEKGEALAEVKKQHVELLPIHRVNASDPLDVARHDRVVALVDLMLTLYEHAHSDKQTAHESVALQRQISATNEQLDRLVYALYGLTDEEIALVEGATVS